MLIKGGPGLKYISPIYIYTVVVHVHVPRLIISCFDLGHGTVLINLVNVNKIRLMFLEQSVGRGFIVLATPCVEASCMGLYFVCGLVYSNRRWAHISMGSKPRVLLLVSDCIRLTAIFTGIRPQWRTMHHINHCNEAIVVNLLTLTT